MRTQSKIFDEAVYTALKGTEPDVAISTTNIEIGAKGGGGLSDLNETLMIKGQPHKLAWIRPDEASALKAMGGSGKKVGGIPAYFDEWSWAESADVFSDAVQPDGSIPDAGTGDYLPYHDHLTDIVPNITPELYEIMMNRDPGDPRMYSSESPELRLGLAPGTLDPETGVGTGGSDEFEGRSGLETFGDRARTFQSLGNIPGALERFNESMRDQLPSNVYSTYFNAVLEKTGDMDKTQKIVDAALATPGIPEELIARFEGSKSFFSGDKGYQFGGPGPTLMNILATNVRDDFGPTIKKHLQKDKYLKEMEKETGITVEEEAEGLFGTVLNKLSNVFLGPEGLDSESLESLQAEIKERGGEFTPMSGFGRGLQAVLTPTFMKVISSVLGGRPIGTLETSVGTFYVGEDGSLVNAAIDATPDTGNEIESPYRSAISLPTKTVTESVKEAGPMETFQAGLESTDIDTGTANKIKILMDQYGISENQARQMIGLDINVA